MKKNLLFLIPMIIVAILLFMLRTTGMIAHIALSVVGLVVLVAYAVATKKEWKVPTLEIVQRVFYAIALISGVLLMNVHGVALISIVHKISAAFFAIFLFVTEVHKVISK